MLFRRIRTIDPDDPASWEDGFFLTFDFDWASDPILEDCIGLVERAGVAATWFVTHDTPLLDRLRANPAFELGIHPNFNELIEGRPDGKNAESVVAELLELVPGAVSVRSHSMLQSSRVLALFQRLGLRYDCNHFLPAHTGIVLRPWADWTGMIRVPYFWEDDVAAAEGFRESPTDLVKAEGLRVADFHPIHVALNTRDLNVYERSRESHADLDALQRFRKDGPGARAFLESLTGFGSAP